MPEPKTPALTRRQFATTALLTTAAATLAPISPTRAADNPPQTPAPSAEATLRLQTILALYGTQLSEDQKTDLKKICNQAQSSLDRLRAYPTENSDDPALYLKPLWEHEKNPLEPNNHHQIPAAPKS